MQITATLLPESSGPGKVDIKNYRLRSNIAFISELVEKATTRGMEEHVQNNDLHDSNQSLYWTNN